MVCQSVLVPVWMEPAGIGGGTDLVIRDSGFLGSRMRLPSVTRVLVAGMSQFGQGMYVGTLAVMASRERSRGHGGGQPRR